MNGTRTGSTAVAAAAAAARREGNPGRRGRGRQEPATQARRGSWSDGCGEEDAAAAAAARTSSSMARRGAPSAANGHGEGKGPGKSAPADLAKESKAARFGFGCRAARARRRYGGVVAAVTAWRDARPFAKGMGHAAMLRRPRGEPRPAGSPRCRGSVRTRQDFSLVCPSPAATCVVLFLAKFLNVCFSKKKILNVTWMILPFVFIHELAAKIVSRFLFIHCSCSAYD